jgi:hypothetical protein
LVCWHWHLLLLRLLLLLMLLHWGRHSGIVGALGLGGCPCPCRRVLGDRRRTGLGHLGIVDALGFARVAAAVLAASGNGAAMANIPMAAAASMAAAAASAPAVAGGPCRCGAVVLWDMAAG